MIAFWQVISGSLRDLLHFHQSSRNSQDKGQTPTVVVHIRYVCTYACNVHTHTVHTSIFEDCGYT